MPARKGSTVFSIPYEMVIMMTLMMIIMRIRGRKAVKTYSVIVSHRYRVKTLGIKLREERV
jgi:hypothetical protein